MQKIVAFLLLGFVLISVQLCHGEDQTFVKLQKRYFVLKNRDKNIIKTDEWREVAAKLFSYAYENPMANESPLALLLSARAYSSIYSASRDLSALDKAIKALDIIAAKYTGHELADDALLLKGDLLTKLPGGKSKARSAYREIVRAYPNSDMAIIAAVRLGMVSLGKKDKSKLPIKMYPDRPLIVIDPGHGGEDSGARGSRGLLEKDVTLDIAERLRRLIKASGVYNVRLTRNDDTFLHLQDRTAFANDLGADLFISIHVNAAHKNQHLSGVETYYLDNTSDEASIKLAERENQYYSATVVPDINFIISDLIQSAKLDDSIRLAKTVQRELVTNLKKRWGEIRDLGVKKAPFYVLVGAHMPCVLVEIMFISNKKDEAKLANETFRSDVALALYRAISNFLGDPDAG